jgi:hypothetical protein
VDVTLHVHPSFLSLPAMSWRISSTVVCARLIHLRTRWERAYTIIEGSSLRGSEWPEPTSWLRARGGEAFVDGKDSVNRGHLPDIESRRMLVTFCLDQLQLRL